MCSDTCRLAACMRSSRVTESRSRPVCGRLKASWRGWIRSLRSCRGGEVRFAPDSLLGASWILLLGPPATVSSVVASSCSVCVGGVRRAGDSRPASRRANKSGARVDAIGVSARAAPPLRRRMEAFPSYIAGAYIWGAELENTTIDCSGLAARITVNSPNRLKCLTS